MVTWKYTYTIMHVYIQLHIHYIKVITAMDLNTQYTKYVHLYIIITQHVRIVIN